MSDPSAAARLMGPSTGASEAADASREASGRSVLTRVDRLSAAPTFFIDVTDPKVFSFVLGLMCSALFGRRSFASVKSTEMSAVRCSDYVAAQVRR
jgi:hypothetical protein